MNSCTDLTLCCQLVALQCQTDLKSARKQALVGGHDENLPHGNKQKVRLRFECRLFNVRLTAICACYEID